MLQQRATKKEEETEITTHNSRTSEDRDHKPNLKPKLKPKPK